MKKLLQCIRLSVYKKNIIKMFLSVLILIFCSYIPSFAQDCVTYVYPSYSSPLYFDYSGTGSGVIGVSLANSQCGFSYYTTADWITVTRAPNTYTRLSVTCSANTTGVNRSGIIWIDKYGVQVVQYPQLAAPIISTVTNITESSFTANWSSVTNAAGYRLDVSTNSSFTAILSGYNDLFVSGTSLTVSGLSPNTNYYYRVRAYNSSYGTSNSSSVANALTMFQAPAAANATAVTASSFNANWSAVTGAASYRLDVSTNSDFSSYVGAYNNYSVTTISQAVSSLSAGTTYYYRVRAVNASGASANSNTITVLTLPAAPTFSTVTNLGTSSFSVNWGGVPSATEYRLDVSTSDVFSNFVTGYNNLQVASTSANVIGLNPNTTYYYRVRAINGTGTSANSSIGTTLTLLLAAAANAATSITASSFNANWSAAQGAASYRLDVSTSSNFSSFVGSYNNYSVTAISQAVSSLSAGTTYYYRVRAVNASGASANSNTITVLTLPAAPSLSVSGTIQASSFTIAWGSVTSATSYQLDVSTNSTFSSMVPSYNNLAVTGTSKVISGLYPLVTYYVRIRAVNATGSSASSNVISANTVDNNGSYNYIKTTVMQEPFSDRNLVNTLPVESRAVDIAFFDGLGRPLQIVSWQATPGKKDLIQPIAYDKFGRESIKYLPYTDAVSDGSYRTNAVNVTYSQSDQYKFYHNGFSNTSAIALDDSAYARTVFEPSPLNRVMQQGAAGVTWQPSAGKVLASDYLTNKANEVKLWKVVTDSTFSQGSSYAAGELYVTMLTDENQHVTKEYKDKEGHVILKKSYTGADSLQTYYLYDDFGLLRYVLPPQASATTPTSLAPGNALVKQLCYYYQYDARQRMIVKQLPGADRVYMVYDGRDRLTASQDGNQRKTGEWLFTKYDAFNRPVMSGVFKPAETTREALQTAVNTYYNSSGVNWYTERSNQSTLTNATGYYITRSYPESVTESNLRSLTYYDNYDTIPGLKKFVAVSELKDSVQNTKVKGQVTATRVKVLDGGNSWITTSIYYDDKYRVIQTVKNNYINGDDRLTTRYDFVGKVMQTRLVHTGLTGKRVDKTFEYDHAGRLVKIFHSVDGTTPVLMSYMKYNELGQLVDKKLHVTDKDNYNTYVQSIDYRYNIRGWLNSINNPGLTNDSGTTNDDTTDKFGMKLMYNN